MPFSLLKGERHVFCFTHHYIIHIAKSHALTEIFRASSLFGNGMLAKLPSTLDSLSLVDGGWGWWETQGSGLQIYTYTLYI